ncbi:MAG: hypothetical protein K0S07_1480 [Chlamydiales bacterium]|jgi:nucleoside-diphosphate-sugar epimerase|nr:hypothetical protein [Chlamydiales bacterium]
MKCGIIGCGYVGMAFLKKWQEKGHQGFATTTTASRLSEIERTGAEAILLSVERQKALANLLSKVDCLLIGVAPKKRDLATYESCYLETNKEIASLAPPSLKHIIYLSSTSVYGNQGGLSVKEETPLQPQNPFAEILLKAESLLALLPSTILRLGQIYGPGRSLFNKALPSVLGGSGEEKTALIHQQDIVQAALFTLEQKLFGTFNVINDLKLTRRELYQALQRDVTFDPSLPLIHGGNRSISNEKIKAHGFSFHHQTLE